MSLVIADRVQETTNSTGTGNITVSNSSTTGYRTFASTGLFTTGKTFPYVVESSDKTAWETGIGTVVSTGPLVFSRDVKASTNSNTAINVSVGMTVFCDATSELLKNSLTDAEYNWLYGQLPSSVYVLPGGVTVNKSATDGNGKLIYQQLLIAGWNTEIYVIDRTAFTTGDVLRILTDNGTQWNHTGTPNIILRFDGQTISRQNWYGISLNSLGCGTIGQANAYMLANFSTMDRAPKYYTFWDGSVEYDYFLLNPNLMYEVYFYGTIDVVFHGQDVADFMDGLLPWSKISKIGAKPGDISALPRGAAAPSNDGTYDYMDFGLSYAGKTGGVYEDNLFWNLTGDTRIIMNDTNYRGVGILNSAGVPIVISCVNSDKNPYGDINGQPSISIETDGYVWLQGINNGSLKVVAASDATLVYGTHRFSQKYDVTLNYNITIADTHKLLRLSSGGLNTTLLVDPNDLDSGQWVDVQNNSGFTVNIVCGAGGVQNTDHTGGLNYVNGVESFAIPNNVVIKLMCLDGNVFIVQSSDPSLVYKNVTTNNVATLTNKTINDPSNFVDADATHQKVYLNLGSASTKGMAVQSGVWNSGNNCAAVSKCTSADATPCLGLMETATADGQVGAVRTDGVLTGVNTNAWSEGAILYVSSTAGVLTATRPTSGYAKSVGVVERQDPTNGVINVRIGDVEPAVASSGGGDGGFAFKASFSTQTDGTTGMGNGVIQFSNASPASAQFVYIYENDSNGTGFDALLDELDPGDYVMLSNGDRSKWQTFIVRDQFTSGANIDNLPVTWTMGSASNFSNGETIYLSIARKDFRYTIGKILPLTTAGYCL